MIFYNKIEFQIDVDLIRIIKISIKTSKIELSFKKRPSGASSCNLVSIFFDMSVICEYMRHGSESGMNGGSGRPTFVTF